MKIRALKISGKTLVNYDGTGEVFALKIDGLIYRYGSYATDFVKGEWYSDNKGNPTQTANRFKIGIVLNGMFYAAIADTEGGNHSHSNITALDSVSGINTGDQDLSSLNAHAASTHAPGDAQKNSDITKAEIENKLTGQISSHSHAGGGSVNIKQVEVDFGNIPVSNKQFIITDADISLSNKIIAGIAYDSEDAEWFEDLNIMARAGTEQAIFYCKSPHADTNGLCKITYLIG